MNPIVVLVVVLVMGRYLQLPDSWSFLLAIIAVTIEALGGLLRWSAEYNAAKLKKVIHE
jgi:hypothetical protein